MRKIGAVLLALCVWALATANRADARSLELDANANVVELSRYMEVYENAGPRMTLGQARTALAAGRFQARKTAAPLDFGYSDHSYWLHVRLQAPDAKAHRWVLDAGYPLLDHFEIWLLANGRLIRHVSGGQAYPFAQRDYRFHELNFELPLAANGSATDLFVRVRSQSKLSVPLVLYARPAFFAHAMHSQVLLGGYFGALLALLVYNLVLFASIRDRNFLYYVFYVGAEWLLLFSLAGLAFRFLWPHHPEWNKPALIVAIALFVIGMIQFARAYLEIHRYLPRLDHVLRAAVWVECVFVVLAWILAYPILAHVQNAIVLVVTLSLLGIAAYCLWRGSIPARYFVVAWSLAIVGFTAYGLMIAGLLPRNVFTGHAIQIGVGAEMVLLSFALAQRIRERDKRNLALITDARDTLEQRVGERTKELASAMRKLSTTMDRLSDANRKLRDTSERDGLTGVYNRRHLDAMLESKWREAVQTRVPISMLLVDLDAFKPINDSFGHLVGDDCLRQVAQCLLDVTEGTAAEVARYGGDEFAVIWLGAGADRVNALARRLRHELARRVVRVDNNELRINISVGSGSVIPTSRDNDGMRDLMHEADTSLYEAKRRRGGRLYGSVRDPT